MIDKFKSNPLLIIRIALGIAFILHGADKLLNLNSFSQNLGMSVAVIAGVGLVELVAGLGVLFNKYIKIAAGLIIVVMIAAIALVKYKAGYLNGYELDIAYIAMAISLICASLGSDDSVDSSDNEPMREAERDDSRMGGGPDRESTLE